MKKLLSPLVVALALVGGSSARVWAVEPLATGDIPFAFHAGGKTLPAGKYDILLENAQSNVLVVRDYGTKKTIFVPFTTRLAARNDDHAELIFDKDPNGLYLSEIFVGDSDGYFIPGAPGRHTHEHVKATKAAKAPEKK